MPKYFGYNISKYYRPSSVLSSYGIRKPSLRMFGGGMPSFKVTIRIKGMNTIIRKLEAYGNIAPKLSLVGIKAALKLLVAEAKRLIKKGYYRPAYKTGDLFRSIKGRVKKSSNKLLVTGEFGTDIYYGVYVHEGTKYMIERPFLVDALENKKAEINALIKSAFQIGIKL